MATPPTSMESPISVNSGPIGDTISSSGPALCNWAARSQQQGIDRIERCDEVYDSVVKAYDYTNSYHFLMKFLPTR